MPCAKLRAMQWPETCKVCESPAPRSFAALMELYEQNYIRLRCLCPGLKDITGEVVSQAPGAHALHLIVTEQHRHTTTLRLTYIMDNGDRRPDLTLRVYHDALQAEVLSRRCRWQGLVQARREPGESALLCKWRLNRFLYKWLNYCRRQGHGFGARPGSGAPATPSLRHPSEISLAP